MKRRGISLELDGFNLVGEVYIPAQHPCPALILCHGIPRGIPDSSDRGYPFLAERFTKAGFLTFIFNFRGTGDSGGNFDIAGWTRDLETVLDHVYNMREVEKEKIFVMGFSGGAAVSVYVASEDQRVSSLVLCSCPAEFRLVTDVTRAKSTIEHFRRVGIIRDDNFPPSVDEWLDSFSKLSPISRIKKISPRPLLIVHGAEDDVVNPQDAWALYESAGEPKDILIVEGAGHRLRIAEKAIDGALNWLRAQV